jgi:SAM-dependent methyltransferase
VRCVAHISETAEDADAIGDAILLDVRDRVVAWVRGARLRPVAQPARDTTEWFHRLEWRETTVAAAITSRDLERAADAVDADWLNMSTRAGLQDYVAQLPALRRRVRDHVARAATALDLLAGMHNVAPALRPAAARLLSLLDADADESETSPPPSPVLDLVDRCGEALADILSGRTDPLTVLFPAGDAAITRAIYGDTAFGLAFNDAVGRAVVELIGTHPRDVPIRILEVGAGSGSTAERVLELLGDRRVEYTFTDISHGLLAGAERRLASLAGVSYRVLDLEADDDAPTCHDIVIAANVVHATTDVRASLRRIRAMLVPGGALVLLEGTRPEPWVDMTFGLTPGWWRFADTDLRPDHPLMPRARWLGVLAEVGFDHVAAVAADDRSAAVGQAVLLARRPAAARVVLPRQSDLRRSLEIVGHTVVSSADATPDSLWLFDGRAGADPAFLLADMQRLAASPDDGTLWVLTTMAQSVAPEDRPDPRSAALWGLARTFALEHPNRFGGVVDVGLSAGSAEVVAALTAEWRSGSEDQTAWRNGRRYAPRIIRNAPGEGTIAIRDAWLVTGGLGGLGLRVGAWLVARGASTVVLVGRSARREEWAHDDPRRRAVEAMEAAGARVLVRAVDAADRVAVSALLDEVRGTAPLRGVVHAAAVFDESPIVKLDAAMLDAVMRAKVSAAEHLIELTAADELDGAVLFSSTTSLLGVAGMAAYAAANQGLDALAARARIEGRPVVAINWGIWDEMRLAGNEARERYRRTGLIPMAASDALDALGRALASGAAQWIVAGVNWDRLRALYEARRRRPLLSELVSTAETPVQVETHADDPRAVLAGMPAEARRRRIAGMVEREVRAVLRLPVERLVDHGLGYFEMGMDSLMSMELRSRLEKAFALRLPATLTFNYSTIHAVGEFLDARLGGSTDDGPMAAATDAPAVSGVSSIDVPDETASEEQTEAALVALLTERLDRLGAH